MALRTTSSTVTFASPFRLKDFTTAQAAGTYKVETDEEIIEGNERTVYRRVATLLYLHNGGSIRIRAVDPEDLEAALVRDRTGVAVSD